MEETVQAVEEEACQPTESSPTDTQKQAKSVEFTEVPESDVVGVGGSIDILLDMKVPVTVIIGHTEMPVQRFLRLGPGSVLKLNKSIDEPVELYLRDAKFATGSVVVVEDRFAVRIKQVLGLGNSTNNTTEVKA